MFSVLLNQCNQEKSEKVSSIRSLAPFEKIHDIHDTKKSNCVFILQSISSMGMLRDLLRWDGGQSVKILGHA